MRNEIVADDQQTVIWQPADATPAAPGMYIRNFGGTFVSPNPGPLPLFSRWDGRQWMNGYVTMRPAAMTRHPTNERLRALPWRELIEPDLQPELLELNETSK